MFKIATMADWFGKGPVAGIRESAAAGAEGVQLYAWNTLNPMDVTRNTIQELRAVSQGCGQAVTAICGELSEIAPGGRGLEVAAENPRKVEFLKRCVDLAKALDCDVVTTHIGVIPADAASDRHKAMHEACEEVGEYAAQMDAYIAIETGPEPIPVLCAFADSCKSGRIAVNYDPANLIMVTNVDPVAGVYTAASRIVHTHAKDGVMHQYLGTEPVYEMFATGGVEVFETLPQYFAEKPLGQGSLNWPAYLRALKDVGYTGYLTIEREVGQNAAADIREAVVFLQKMLKQMR